MSRIAVIEPLQVATYERHELHAEDCIWVEKNCYVDLWIEILHSLRLEPRACMGFTLAADFEGDQWTFFKPSHDELRELYGVDVQELTVWRPLIEHAIEHLAAGKWLSTEADAFWLPDTAGTDYRRQHTKTTIVLNDIDVEAKRLGYFHNAGYFTLQGEDFVKTFRLDVDGDDAGFLPLFAELVRIDRVLKREESELKSLSRGFLRKHVARRPPTNPIGRFKERFERDLPGLQAAGPAEYHRWAFAGVRQLGAAFELVAQHLDWLGPEEFAAPIEAFRSIANGSKILIFKAARAVNFGRTLDSSAGFDEMSQAWERGMVALNP
ncbi:MAG: DUF1839 family protein [Burkholderiales bacterium]|nr:DUF1839 family protein [Burkholderiales bacterium]